MYIASNPFTSRLAGNSFHDLIEVWTTDFDDDTGTVPADAVREAALTTAEKYPNKRLIVHFMQPHFPFVTSNLQYDGWNPKDMVGERPDDAMNPWDALREGYLDRDTLWNDYRENLNYVLDYAWAVADELSGRAVMTSDHGNMMGEMSWPIPMRFYDHPRRLRFEGLMRVPWAIASDGEREIRDDGVRSSANYESENLEGRLEDLGYVG